MSHYSCPLCRQTVKNLKLLETSYSDGLIVRVLFNQLRIEVLVQPKEQQSFKFFQARLASLLHLSPGHTKLIVKGHLLGQDTFQDFIQRKPRPPPLQVVGGVAGRGWKMDEGKDAGNTGRLLESCLVC